jgi:putative ABC transport system permease protein
VVMGPPPGVVNASRVLTIHHFPTGSGPIRSLSWGDYQDLRRRQTVFEHVTGWTIFRPALVANGYSETGIAELVDADYFQVVGVPARLGRLLQPADDRPDAPPVAVISTTLWQRMFGSAPDVVGRLIKINGTTFEIVGVPQDDFQGLFNGGLIATRLWVPMSASRLFPPTARADLDPDDRENRWVSARGRLKPEYSVAQAEAQVAAIGKQLDAEFPIGRSAPPQFRSPARVSRLWRVAPLNHRVFGVPDDVMQGLAATLLTAGVLVLLVACTNLANLMLARNSQHRSDMSIRLALGASRWRLMREAMAEPLILAAVGGLLGLAVARVLMRLFSAEIAIGNGSVLQALPEIDLVVLLAGFVCVVLSLLIVGVIPALQSTRVDVRGALASGAGAVVPRWRGRRYLIALQVAVSVLLVAVATLYVGELRRRTRIDTGVDLDRLALAHVDFRNQSYDEQRIRQVSEAVIRQMTRPGVESVSVSAGLPFGLTPPAVASLQAAGQSSSVNVWSVSGTARLLETFGVRVTRGRTFDNRDTSESLPVVILSESAATHAFGTANVVGREVVFQRRAEPPQPPRAMTVVGIAEERVTDISSRGSLGTAYRPIDQQPEVNLVFAVRAAGRPEPLVGELGKAVAAADPDLAVTQAGTGLALAGPDVTFPRIVAGLAGALGTMALVLALTGLYGVLSHVVAGRTKEIGLRIALGAGAARIQRMLLKEGLSPVLIGMAAGFGVAAVARAGLQPMFQRIVPAIDTGLIALVPALFIAAGLVACYLPARRASRVDPNVALRNR